MLLGLKKIGFIFALTAVVLSSCESPAQPFKLAIMPDTQSCTEGHPEIYMKQTKWIADNGADFAFVLQAGDMSDWDSDKQWTNVVAGFNQLEGKVKYAFVPGNHDYADNAATPRNTTKMNAYLPYQKYSKAEHFGGAYETGKVDNTWHTFKAGGKDWLVLCLEFGPRNKVIDWANEIVKQHPNHKIILNTHAYMYADNTRMGKGDDWLPQSYGVGKDTGDDAVNNGEQIWEKLVSLHKNFVFVFSGHVLHSGVGTLVSTGVNGNKVYQMLANYQGGVIRSENGGYGYTRILTIDPEKKTVDVKTYSPYLDKYDTRAEHQFTFEDVEL